MQRQVILCEYKGLEHLWILVAGGFFEPVACQIPKDNSIGEAIKRNLMPKKKKNPFTNKVLS